MNEQIQLVASLLLSEASSVCSSVCALLPSMLSEVPNLGFFLQLLSGTERGEPFTKKRWNSQASGLGGSPETEVGDPKKLGQGLRGLREDVLGDALSCPAQALAHRPMQEHSQTLGHAAVTERA